MLELACKIALLALSRDCLLVLKVFGLCLARNDCVVWYSICVWVFVVRDMLKPLTADAAKLQVKESKDGMYVPGITEVPVNSSAEVRARLCCCWLVIYLLVCASCAEMKACSVLGARARH